MSGANYDRDHGNYYLFKRQRESPSGVADGNIGHGVAMGGRRARSLKEIVGGGLSSLSANFTRAVNQGDPNAVAVSSAKLLAGSKKTGGILFYVSQLSDFIRRI